MHHQNLLLSSLRRNIFISTEPMQFIVTYLIYIWVYQAVAACATNFAEMNSSRIKCVFFFFVACAYAFKFKIAFDTLNSEYDGFVNSAINGQNDIYVYACQPSGKSAYLLILYTKFTWFHVHCKRIPQIGKWPNMAIHRSQRAHYGIMLICIQYA